jgi:hypothetical protein
MVLRRFIITLLLLSIVYADEDANEVNDDDLKEVTTVLDGKTVCATQVQCGNDGFYFCDDEKKVCIHKDIFPMLPIEIGGTVVLMLLQTLAVMSGLGGGGIIVPLCMAFFSYDVKKTVAISGFTILIGSYTRFFLTMNFKHPLKDATLIEYSLVNIMLPTVLFGSVTGVFINMLLPEMTQQILMFALFVFLATQSGFKFAEIYKKESKQKQTTVT